MFNRLYTDLLQTNPHLDEESKLKVLHAVLILSEAEITHRYCFNLALARSEKLVLIRKIMEEHQFSNQPSDKILALNMLKDVMSTLDDTFYKNMGWVKDDLGRRITKIISEEEDKRNSLNKSAFRQPYL